MKGKNPFSPVSFYGWTTNLALSSDTTRQTGEMQGGVSEMSLTFIEKDQGLSEELIVKREEGLKLLEPMPESLKSN